jgi:hypothetical protein
MDLVYCLSRFTSEEELEKFIRRVRISVDYYTRKCTPGRRDRLVRTYATIEYLTSHFSWFEWRELHMVCTLVSLILRSVRIGGRQS